MENENLIFIPPWSATQGQGFWGATGRASHSTSVEYAVVTTAAARELNPHILFHTVSLHALISLPPSHQVRTPASFSSSSYQMWSDVIASLKKNKKKTRPVCVAKK